MRICEFDLSVLKANGLFHPSLGRSATKALGIERKNSGGLKVRSIRRDKSHMIKRTFSPLDSYV